MSRRSPPTNSRPISLKCLPSSLAASRQRNLSPLVGEVERVVLNALTKTRGVAAGYRRLRRAKWHRLEDKPIHLRSRCIQIRAGFAVELTTPAKYLRSLLQSRRGNYRPGTSR